MTLGIAEVAALWTAGGIVGSALFWGIFHLGRLASRVERVEGKTEDLENRMDRAGQKMSDLADEVQKMPDRFIERREAILWNGSRSGDIKP